MMPLSSPLRPLRQCGNCDFRSLRMFCSLGSEALEEFESIGAHSTLPRGAKLFQENSPSQGVFVICSGQVKLSCTSREGRTLILKIAMPGDVLGLGAVISGSKYEVTAETVQPAEIKSIRREEFSPSSRSMDRPVFMPPRPSPRSTRLPSSMRGDWRSPAQPLDGSPASCSIGAAQSHAANQRCASPWRSRTRNWPTWSVAHARP
jgi:hypothetical protein